LSAAKPGKSHAGRCWVSFLNPAYVSLLNPAYVSFLNPAYVSFLNPADISPPATLARGAVRRHT